MTPDGPWLVSGFPRGRRDRLGLLALIRHPSARLSRLGARSPTSSHPYGVQASLAFPVAETTFGLSTSTWNQWSPAASTLNFWVKVFVPEAVKA